MEKLKRDLRDLDKQIIELINERYLRAMAATDDGLPVPELTAADLERASLEQLEKLNRGPMHAPTLHAIYREILSGQFDLVRPAKVAFFGSQGSFTHLATMRKFGESVTTVSKPTINDVFDDVAKGIVEFGVVPVENSTEGAVTTTFDLFQDTSVTVYSEIYVRIHHYLMARCPLDDVQVVYSHPQAIGQCRRWIQQNLSGVELVEVTSTTAAAERAASEPHAAAIAGLMAAELYDLRLLAEHIEDFSENITRFLVLSKHIAEQTGDDKTSLMFAVQDRVGALYDTLLPFKNAGVNMTMIQSRPSKRKSWDYLFFVDCLGSSSDPGIERAIKELQSTCKYVKILGSYPRASDPI